MSNLTDNAKLWIGMIGLAAVIGIIVLAVFGVTDPAILAGLGGLALAAQSALAGITVPSNQRTIEERPPPPPGR